MAPSLSLERLSLTDFRNYAHVVIETGPGPIVLFGLNGSGKTNILEAISLLAPGQGLRRAPYPDLLRAGANGGWAVAARVNSRSGRAEIGTGFSPSAAAGQRAGTGRVVRIDGEPAGGSGALADFVEIVWLTPAMDGLFTGPASERRRFLDRLVLCFDPGFRSLAGRFERATQSRNRLLADGVRDNARLEGVEIIMAEAGTAIAAARISTVRRLCDVIAARRLRDPDSPFPWSGIELEGSLESALASAPAVDVEDSYARRLASMRERDRAAGRTLEGPHRSDLIVSHGPKNMPARLSSTGEQKALLIGLVMAEAELIAMRHSGSAPLLLLDEITAHLDDRRRAGLFSEILRLGAQAWMTGTDLSAFSALSGQATMLRVADAGLHSVHA
ncbi:DNA replication and repair protein RecF [Candidatus Filomicrobium marinum]|uniref:DNA replication and repair protein RecF n=1 Tax=Candidatus Filomicrobium marinum TaxID=1608628 RepID=A0A0D6JCY4_9HYPH|nr:MULTISPECIES: DNA replication/repair protein RecF [Filomicrobium]MCV0368286.1 DNA replication/repair protein RecF [Filomicrobium sp.]CFX12929.1 DNA replication and repair protein RecF [Candidatus Filomicrobium marinum]CPR17525.1 DNA replication and repair protein RecF [Candidatus Filomicrobium marinum]